MQYDRHLPDGLFVVGHRIYSICRYCGGIVRVDKPLFGSLHFCLTDEQRKERERIAREHNV